MQTILVHLSRASDQPRARLESGLLAGRLSSSELRARARLLKQIANDLDQGACGRLEYSVTANGGVPA